MPKIFVDPAFGKHGVSFASMQSSWRAQRVTVRNRTSAISRRASSKRRLHCAAVSVLGGAEDGLAASNDGLAVADVAASDEMAAEAIDDGDASSPVVNAGPATRFFVHATMAGATATVRRSEPRSNLWVERAGMRLRRLTWRVDLPTQI